MVSNMKIKVIHPFSLRPGSGQPVRDFPVGMHNITEEELAHWFLKDCLKEGRAALLADEAEGDGGKDELVAPTRDELMKLTRDKLVELAAACGITVADTANKSAICDLLLAGHEGVTIVNGPDGIYVEKAE